MKRQYQQPIINFVLLRMASSIMIISGETNQNDGGQGGAGTPGGTLVPGRKIFA